MSSTTSSRRSSHVLGTSRATRVNFGDFVFRASILLVLFAICAAWYFFSASSPYYHKSNYWVKFTDASGLKVGGEVIVDGLKVGQIREIKLDREQGVVFVQISLPQDLRVPKATAVGVYVRSLVGEKALDLRINQSQGPFWKMGDTLSGQFTPDPTQLMAYFYSFASEAQGALQDIKELKSVLDSANAPAKFDSIWNGFQILDRKATSMLSNLKSSLSQSATSLGGSVDSARALARYASNQDLAQQSTALMSEMKSLKQKLIDLKQRDQKLWEQSAPRQELDKVDLKPSIERALVRLDTLYSILRQGRLELNPDFF